MKLFEIVLDYERSTKGTHVYSVEANGRPLTFYAPRDKLPANPPERMKITAESAE
jgi:hypothetical protein